MRQDFGDAYAQLFGLDQGLDEAVKLLDPHATAHVVKRLEPGAAQAHLVEDLGELLGEGVLVLLCNSRQRGVETQARFNRDRQQVEGVGQSQPDLLLAPL